MKPDYSERARCGQTSIRPERPRTNCAECTCALASTAWATAAAGGSAARAEPRPASTAAAPAGPALRDAPPTCTSGCAACSRPSRGRTAGAGWRAGERAGTSRRKTAALPARTRPCAAWRPALRCGRVARVPRPWLRASCLGGGLAGRVGCGVAVVGEGV